MYYLYKPYISPIKKLDNLLIIIELFYVVWLDVEGMLIVTEGMKYMETERLKLMPPSMGLQPQLLEAIVESQSELSVYLPWVPFALTEEESIEDMKRAIHKFDSFEGELRHLIIEKRSGRLVGS